MIPENTKLVDLAAVGTALPGFFKVGKYYRYALGATFDLLFVLHSPLHSGQRLWLLH